MNPNFCLVCHFHRFFRVGKGGNSLFDNILFCAGDRGRGRGTGAGGRSSCGGGGGNAGGDGGGGPSSSNFGSTDLHSVVLLDFKSLSFNCKYSG